MLSRRAGLSASAGLSCFWMTVRGNSRLGSLQIHQKLVTFWKDAKQNITQWKINGLCWYIACPIANYQLLISCIPNLKFLGSVTRTSPWSRLFLSLTLTFCRNRLSRLIHSKFAMSCSLMTSRWRSRISWQCNDKFWTPPVKFHVLV